MLYSIPFIVLIAAMLVGVPIAFSLAFAGAVGIWLVTGDIGVLMGLVGSSLYGTVSEYNLTTIPMFILMAYFASSSGVARQLYTCGANWLSNIRGGLAVATVFATAVFGALSGASSASAAVMSQIAMPNMREHGYAEELAAGAIAVGATTDILIPPSVALVIYGLLTDTSIGDLLIAGVFPGILLGLLLAVAILVWVWIKPSLAPDTYRMSWRDRFTSTRGVWPGIVLIFSIIGLLYSGIATPTECAALGCTSTLIMATALRQMTWARIIESAKATLDTTAMIFMILAGAGIFGAFLTLSRLPQNLVTWVISMDLNRWVVMVCIIVAYFVISMFMDELPLMILTLPLTFPLITSLGFDPVWFGVMTMLMVAMGLVFPPVGLTAFVVAASAKVDLVKVYKGTSVLIVAIFATTILVMIFPEIALFLPRSMRAH